MLVLDNNVLSRYLRGEDSAAQFLREYEDEVWAIPSIVLYEALEAAIHGYVEVEPPTLKEQLTATFEVLAITAQTAMEAQAIQQELMDAGIQVENPDVLIAATAAEHGGTFATAEKLFWREEVQTVLDVAEYDPL